VASSHRIPLDQGNTATSTVTTAAFGDFTGVIDLKVSVPGTPTGVTVTLSPTTLTVGGSATLTISTTGSSPGGDFPIVVTGTSGKLTHSVYVTLAMPGFSISAPPRAFLNQSGTVTAPIFVSDVNGFDKAVNFHLSALPRGVEGHFEIDGVNSRKLIFEATPIADTGFTTLTITGTSGKLRQTATVTLAVSAATGGSGFGTEVNLSSAFNLNGIYRNGVQYSNGGLDGGGFSYSANLLTQSRVLDLVHFRFGPANELDAIGAMGQVISLPAGRYFSLFLLGTGVQGSQSDETIRVNYADGTSAKFAQSFSDWFVPQNFPGEVEGVAMAYRNFQDGSMDNRTFNLYAYEFPLNPAKTVESLTLPTDDHVVILAVTLLPAQSSSLNQRH
jgi:hypothetical protein